MGREEPTSSLIERMTDLTENDRALLLEAGGALQEGDVSWVMLRRKGHVLLCLPEDSRYTKGLELYQPQSRVARALVTFLRISGGTGRKLFPFYRQRWGGGGFLRWLVEKAGGTPVSVLFGNAAQRERRVVVLSEHSGGLRVWKCGFSKAAREIIESEHQILATLPKNLPCVPEVSEINQQGGWTAFSMPFFAGKSVTSVELPEVVTLLRGWLSEAKKPAMEFTEIAEFSEQLSVSKSEVLSRVVLRKTLRHGDFAPWNVLREGDGNIHVIDWEMAECEDGVPGWDLVHFLTQEALLIRNLAENEALRWVYKQLETQEASDFLNDAGWGDQRELLLSTYFGFCERREMFDFTQMGMVLRKVINV